MANLFCHSNEQWTVIKPFMPRDQPGPERKDDRQIISGSRVRRIRHDRLRYRERWRIEAMFNRLKDFRRIATRYDKLARNYASALALAAIVAF